MIDPRPLVLDPGEILSVSTREGGSTYFEITREFGHGGSGIVYESVSDDGDFAIYAGPLGDFAGHRPETCTTAGLKTWVLSAAGGDSYYLVVPRSLNREGSYGLDSTGEPRAPSTNPCLPQAVAACD